MAYPRQCEGCGLPYTSWAGAWNLPHLTLAAQDGGTTSPWAPDQPGRILNIGCRLCGSIFRWDYFAAAEGTPRLGKAVELIRGPVKGWRAGDGFYGGQQRPGRMPPAERRAS